MKMYVTHLMLLIVSSLAWISSADDELKLKVVTIATSETDGYERFMRSVKLFSLDVEVVGMGVDWKGGDIVRYPGGGQKINLLKPVVEKWKDEKKLIIMFVDSYDVIFTAGADTILSKFRDFDARVVFSAEGFCWPDQSLSSEYPRVGLGKRFLNSGGFIGYAPEIFSIVSHHKVEDTDDDQLYYTKLYLDKDKREEWSMRLDHRAYIFQNLNGAVDEVEIKFEENNTYAYNTIYDTRAAVYHGNGPSKKFLNNLANYLPSAWNETDGCIVCKEWNKDLPEEKTKWPTVVLAVFIERPSPFLAEMLQKVTELDYPKEKISLWVHNAVSYHEVLVGAWFELVSGDYQSSRYTSSEDSLSEDQAYSTAMEVCLEQSCDYLFTVDSLAMLTEAHTLQRLIEVNRNVVVPFLGRPYRLFSNFWGDVASNGFYARSHDYNLIAEKHRLGVWNVPFVSAAVLISGSWLSKQRKLGDLPSWSNVELDADMAFCEWMRERGHFMYVSNLEEYGHLLNADNYNTDHLNNDMYSMFDNRLDWEKKYLHENWSKVLGEDYEVDMPCPDVYWYPLISETFTKDLIEEMEHHGDWSSGNNNDDRLQGGYENVPTRDIHMKQIGFEPQWLELIKNYVAPVQLKVFPGYFTRVEAYMNFVVKYWPDGQDRLRPHHDASTFTINVALSKPGIDYEGGGCRFVRYNCSVIYPRLGWTFMHPGRLTHLHEGLVVTKGTRYIMVSFIDP